MQRRLGLDSFARQLHAGQLELSSCEPRGSRFRVAYHSQHDGVVPVQALTSVEWHDAPPSTPREVSAVAVRRFGAQQNTFELEHFLSYVSQWQPTCVLEIGTSRGGLLFALAQFAHAEALILTVDLPWPDRYRRIATLHDEMICSMATRHQQACAMRGRSTSAAIKAQVATVLGDRPVDLLFIDGDHSYEGVKGDLETFLPFVSDRGHICLHDILVTKERYPLARTLDGLPPDAGRFWSEIKGPHSLEIVDGSAPAGAEGRAVAWGIGVLSV